MKSQSIKQGFEFLLNGRMIKITILITAAALLFYLLLSVFAGREGLQETFALLSFNKVALILAVILFGWFLRGLRWHYYLRKSGVKEISFWRSLQIFFASFALTLTPGKAGEMVKGYFLKKEQNVALAKTAGILFAERLMDLIAVLLLAFGFIFLDKGQLFIFLIGICLVVFLTAILFGEKIYLKVIQRIKSKRLSRLLGKILHLFAHARYFFKTKIFLVGLPLSVLAWFCEGLAFFLAARFMNIDITLAMALFVYAISTLAGAISMIPGGFLSAEGTMLGLLVLAGVQVQVSVPLILLFRFATVWFIPLVGFGFMLNLAVRGRPPKNLDPSF